MPRTKGRGSSRHTRQATIRSTAVNAQMNDGKTTIVEIMCTQELGDPFRRDALSKPVRLLDKYKNYT